MTSMLSKQNEYLYSNDKMLLFIICFNARIAKIKAQMHKMQKLKAQMKA